VGQSVTLFDNYAGQCTTSVHTCNARIRKDGTTDNKSTTLSGGTGYFTCDANAVAAQAGAISPITIKAQPAIVRYDGSSMISWNGGNAQSCSVAGPYFAASGVSGNQLATSIQAERTYTLSCVFGGLNTTPIVQTTSVTVKIVPLWREF
jgi:hypothetical protein